MNYLLESIAEARAFTQVPCPALTRLPGCSQVYLQNFMLSKALVDPSLDLRLPLSENYCRLAAFSSLLVSHTLAYV